MLCLTLESKKFEMDWVLAGQREGPSGVVVLEGICPWVDRVAIFQGVSLGGY